MPSLYKHESSDPKYNAQRNLCGRTHYVDDETLRFHKSRVLMTRVACGGLIFAIITSDALDYQNTRRGYRYVVFDVFGNVLDRPKLDDSFKRRELAEQAMWAFINGIDAESATLRAARNYRAHVNYEIKTLRAQIARLKKENLIEKAAE